MKPKNSYLVLDAVLIAGTMVCKAANLAVPEYAKEQAYNKVHVYADNVNEFRHQQILPNGGLEEPYTGIGIGLYRRTFCNSMELATLFGAHALILADFGIIADCQHVFKAGFQPGTFKAPVKHMQEYDLLNEIAEDIYATFDIEGFCNDIMRAYIRWLDEYNRLTGIDTSTVGNLSVIVEIAEFHFQEFLRTYDVRELMKEYFVALFNKKVGTAVEKSTNAPGVGLNHDIVDTIFKNSDLCVYGPATWNQATKDLFISTFNAIKGVKEERTQNDSKVAVTYEGVTKQLTAKQKSLFDQFQTALRDLFDSF